LKFFELGTLWLPGVQTSLVTTLFYVFPRHAEAEEIAFDVRTPLRLAYDFLHQVSMWIFQVVDQHCTPHHARSGALQPSDFVIHHEAIHVPVVVIITQAHWNSAAVVNWRAVLMLP